MLENESPRNPRSRGRGGASGKPGFHETDMAPRPKKSRRGRTFAPSRHDARKPCEVQRPVLMHWGDVRPDGGAQQLAHGSMRAIQRMSGMWGGTPRVAAARRHGLSTRHPTDLHAPRNRAAVAAETPASGLAVRPARRSGVMRFASRRAPLPRCPPGRSCGSLTGHLTGHLPVDVPGNQSRVDRLEGHRPLAQTVSVAARFDTRRRATAPNAATPASISRMLDGSGTAGTTGMNERV
jgi:hypothetical protein